MSKWSKIGIISVVVLIFVVLIYYFGRSKQEVYVSDSWSKTYDPVDKGPYGTFVLKDLLDTNGLFGNFIDLNLPLEEGLVNNEDVNDIYFFVGEFNYLPDSSSYYLMDFVREGNTAFMSTHDIPWEIKVDLMYDTDEFFEPQESIDSIEYFKFLHPELMSKRFESKYIYKNKVSLHEWTFLRNDSYDLYDGDTVITLGSTSKDQVNFLKVKYGKGSFYFHSTPYQFTNVSMLKKEGFAYAEYVLAHIPPGRIQWDRYNLKPHYAQSTNSDEDGNGAEDRKSILQFILANPPLFWAMVLLIVSALLFVIFKGRRMQKIIPATESKENTSLEYINTLASLYLQQKRHNKLVNLKQKTFLNFIAEHYYLTCKEPDEKFIEKVAVKSQVPEKEITEIFNLFNNLNKDFQVSDDSLIVLHRKIENFYKKCR